MWGGGSPSDHVDGSGGDFLATVEEAGRAEGAEELLDISVGDGLGCDFRWLAP